MQYAKNVFGAHVIAVDVNEGQLEFAEKYGADLCVNPLKEDVAEFAMKKVGGAHGAVVTAVNKAAFNAAVDSVRAGGTIAAVGLPPEDMELSIPRLVLDGIRLVGSLVGTRKDLEEAFQFGAEGKVLPQCHMRKMEDINDIFDEMLAGKIRGRMVIDLSH